MLKKRERIERQRAALVEQIVRAEQLVTSGRRDFVWFDAFDQDAQERIAALDAEYATLSAIPTVDDVEHRIREIARLVPDTVLLSLFPASARPIVAALGRVLVDQGVVSIDYAAEYRDVMPAPHRVKPRYSRKTWEWSFDDC